MIKSFPQAAIDALAEHYAADEIWLFGSRARGDAREDSEWDLIVLLDVGADTGRHSSALGIEILERFGLKGNVFPMHSDVFHASGDVPNSLARLTEAERKLLHRREGYVPRPMSAAEAASLFIANLKADASDYLTAASLLNGKGYGRINLLRMATRNTLIALLTQAGEHVGPAAYRAGGKMVMLDRLSEKHRCEHLRDGIAVLVKMNGFDLAEAQEYVPQPSSEDDAILDRLHDALNFLLREKL